MYCTGVAPARPTAGRARRRASDSAPRIACSAQHPGERVGEVRLGGRQGAGRVLPRSRRSLAGFRLFALPPRRLSCPAHHDESLAPNVHFRRGGGRRRARRRAVIAAQGAAAGLRSTPTEPRSMAALMPVLLAGALPTDPQLRGEALRETLVAIDGAVAGLAPRAQDELNDLFGAPRARTGALVARARRPRRGADASRDEVERFLDRLRDSRIGLLRAAYDALHQLVMAAWYGNPRAWPAIGYPGPPDLGTGERVMSVAARPKALGLARSRERLPSSLIGTDRRSGSRGRRARLARHRRVDAHRRPHARGRRRHRGQRRGRRHRGRDRSPRPASRVVLVEEGPLRSRRPTSACASPRRIPSSTRNPRRARRATRRSTSCRDAASAAARRSTGRARSARPMPRCALARALGLAGFASGGPRAVVRADGSAAVDRAVGRPAQREQRGARARRREARHPVGDRSAATSRAAGTSAIAAWAAPPTPSSRCSSRRSRARSRAARRW